MTTQVFPWHEALFRQLVGRLGALPHALLLHGREGIGKLSFALTLAQGLVCEGSTGTSPCGSCAPCAWFDASSHPDVRRIEPVSSRTEGDDPGRDDAQIVVDQVRELADFLNLSAHRGGRKVVLLHPAERLNISAANALLKNLEEPPPGVFFLLVSHRPHYLLATIKSRCQFVALPAPTSDAATAWLESQGVVNGSLAAAHTGNAPLLTLDLTDADYWQPRADFLRHLEDPGFDPIGVAEADYPVPHALAWLQKWSYDLAAQKLAGQVRYNPDHRQALAALARRLEALAILRFHREMVRLQRSVHHPLNARLFLENALLSYASLVHHANPVPHAR